MHSELYPPEWRTGVGCYLKRSNVTLGCKQTFDTFTFTKYLTFGIHPYSRLIMQDLVFPRGYVPQAYCGGGWVHSFANSIQNVRQLAKNLWAPISEKFF